MEAQFRPLCAGADMQGLDDLVVTTPAPSTPVIVN